MLEISNISAGYRVSSKPLVILDGASLRCGDSETVSIVGPSGCGKSTILKAIVGLADIYSGKIDGHRSAGFPSTWYQDQDPVFMEFRNSLQNVVLSREAFSEISLVDKRDAQDLIETLHLENALLKYPDELSGGMLKRLALAQSLFSKRKLLLLDEPFSELDGASRRRAEDVVANYLVRPKPRSALIVTHDLDSAVALSDRIYIISNRDTLRIEEWAPWEDTSKQMKTPKMRRAAPNFAEKVGLLQERIVKLDNEEEHA